MGEFGIYPAKEPSKAARALSEQVERDGGHVLAIYQEPVGEHWQIFCLLPRTKVEASPYQRDVSRRAPAGKGAAVPPVALALPRPAWRHLPPLV